MTNIVALSKVAHRSLKVDLRASAAYGDDRPFVQVTVDEFSRLVAHYPVLFARDPDTGQFYCGAMLGFEAGENLFIDEWTEREFYRPLTLRRGPFYARGHEMAIDLDHPRVGAEGGQAIFTEHGQPTKYLRNLLWAFEDLERGIETSRLFVARVAELGLIEPVEIEVQSADGSRHHCRGLHSVKPETLARLPDAVVVELFRRGFLRLIDLMIASLKHVPHLARRKSRRGSPSSHAGTSASAALRASCGR